MAVSRWLGGLTYVRAVAVLNIIALLVYSAFFLIKDRNRIDLALADLPPGSVVLSATDIYGDVEKPGADPRTRFVRRFIKPPHVEVVYEPLGALAAACGERPASFALLTTYQGEPRDGARLLIDLPYAAVSQFPPAWLSSKGRWWNRMWRHKLVTCPEFLRQVGAAGQP